MEDLKINVHVNFNGLGAKNGDDELVAIQVYKIFVLVY